DSKDYKPEKPSDTELVFISNAETIRDYLLRLSVDELKLLAKYILQNVYIVFVQTDDFASSFRLFNVLNSRGLPLSNADLLKNALFESASTHNKKSEQIESAWSQIEDMVGVRRLDKFLTLHKLSEKKDRDRVLQKGFEAFIENLQQQFDGDAIAMSLMLVNSAKNYTKILENDFEHPSIRRKIASLSNLGVDEWIPPVMAFMNRMARTEDFNLDDFSQFITAFEKVYMHGWLKKQIKSQREMVCYSALVAINNDMPFDSVINQINQHADNSGFIAALDEDLYEPRPNQVNLIKAILLRLDMEQQDESVIKTYTGRITIEHILPQALVNEYWINRFQPQEHVYWLHKIGNLTLISGSKNSEAQHYDFIKKKSIYEKLNSKSSFDLTKDVCNSSEWGLAELKMRHEKMKTQLKKLWLV
ncbi:TPA: HNH endonuclease family protein, partial [Escherichia coli]